MSASWQDDDEEFKVRGVRGALRSKPRFSFNELKLLLEAVKRNRNIVLSESWWWMVDLQGSRRDHPASSCLQRSLTTAFRPRSRSRSGLKSPTRSTLWARTTERF